MEKQPIVSISPDGNTLTILNFTFPILWFIFGSADSTDIDITFWIPFELTTANPHFYTRICYELDSLCKFVLGKYNVDVTKPMNSCLAHWIDGKMLWVMKGSVSESNNAIVTTWSNHPQQFKTCDLSLVSRTPDDIHRTILGCLRMIVCSFADATFTNNGLDKLFDLLRSIIMAPEISMIDHKDIKQIVFKIYELKSFVINRCKAILPTSLQRIEVLKKMVKKLEISEIDKFRDIYLESRTIILELVPIIRDSGILSDEHLKALNDDLQGSEFTMHHISRMNTRLRYAFLQTTFLKYVDCTDMLVASPDSIVEIWKKIAFQIGQKLALIRGVELFEKRSIANEFPVLRPFLMRQTITSDDRIAIMGLFRTFVHEIYERNIISPLDTEIPF